VLIDALNDITGSSTFTPAPSGALQYIPKDMSAVELADGSIGSSFLTLFDVPPVTEWKASGSTSLPRPVAAHAQFGHIQSKLQSARSWPHTLLRR